MSCNCLWYSLGWNNWCSYISYLCTLNFQSASLVEKRSILKHIHLLAYHFRSDHFFLVLSDHSSSTFISQIISLDWTCSFYPIIIITFYQCNCQKLKIKLQDHYIKIKWRLLWWIEKVLWKLQKSVITYSIFLHNLCIHILI